MIAVYRSRYNPPPPPPNRFIRVPSATCVRVLSGIRKSVSQISGTVLSTYKSFLKVKVGEGAGSCSGMVCGQGDSRWYRKSSAVGSIESRIASIMYVREEFVRKGWMLDF